ncbi:hypothetical protein [Anaeromyxobacter diazotrophicus]|uniref:Uncharacterized protein n=1 Tax=Anaeromyxobacter diazotrophicus TaxID=2590199 RepID=A0A7I9VSN0_9BACT|nr:hypothetical protein [Anaeromyxobacter diazotrophicus]GEJ59311.1 hypothetical protein AMYX_40520 [Anaeromyxobacter diazotrophicus]
MADAPTLEALPKPLQKHADPKAPLPLRMMGAKGLVPMTAPADLATLLYLLASDAEEAVRATAAKTAEGLPDKLYGVALRSDALAGEVLDWLADRLAAKDAALELVLLNPATKDETVARLAPAVSQPLAEIIRQNELRLLRCDDIVRGLCKNPNALASTVDGACEFCVRNGLTLLDVPQLVAAHLRVHGVDPTAAPPAEDTAQELMRDYSAELVEETQPVTQAETPVEQQKKLNMTQRVLRMSVSDKIKLATLGNKEARTLLLRDSNKLVCMAAVTSPRITDGEIMTIATSRTVNTDVLRHIYTAREYLKVYAIKMALVKNPKVPLPTALKFLYTLQEKDIKELARDRNVPQTIQSQAKAWMMKKEAASKGTASDKH